MAYLLLAITCGVVSALLFPLALSLNLIYSSIFFGYFSYFSAGARNDTAKYAAASNVFGAVLAYILLKLLPGFSGTFGSTWAMMILVFFLAFFYCMAINVDLLSKAFCTFSGGVCVFSTATIMLADKVAYPHATLETALLMAVGCMAIGWVAGYLSCNIPEWLQKADKKEVAS